MADLASTDGELKTETICMQKTTAFALIVVLTMETLSFHFESELIMTVSRVIVDLAFTCPFLLHMILVDFLTRKFSALNKILEKISTVVDTMPLQSTIAWINSVFRLHTHLHIVVWKVNSYFCFYNLLSVITRIVLTLFNAYKYLEEISKGNPLSKTKMPVIMMFELGLFVTQCLLCHSCTKEANQTVMIAHHLLKPDSPVQIWEDVGLFSRLALNNKVHFSVGGVFFLDRPFITKVALVALSYLIIVVQLKDVRSSSNVGSDLKGTGGGGNSIYENFTTSFA
ncbi:uncharacterized protein LOC124355973 [Homalodisca vitripennis]|uniref:uncharacterized protein LOC124355973 n=1 Tax=Homalodisca vitripennis TaxID=197043 RepID=UPI001EEA9E27|nr:uncharacterized protein LOC124355973 [Homalodisca vitripennis]